MRRRALLSTFGAGSLAAAAGCMSRFQDMSVELLQVGVLNWSDEETGVQIRILLDEEIIEEVTYDLDADGGGHVLDCTWPFDPGDFAVAARLSRAEEWETRDLTDPEHDCAAIWVMISDPDGPPSMPISRDCTFYDDRC